MKPLNEIHTPVLLQECLNFLAPAITAWQGTDPVPIVDATLGLGGHANALLAQHPNVRVIAIDRDRQALKHAEKRLAPYSERVSLHHAVYSELANILAAEKTPRVAGVLFDLGVSSLQLDSDERGFAYSRNVTLDMRMNQNEGQSAAELIAAAPSQQLAQIFTRYGEEPLAARYANAIDRARKETPIKTSGQLVQILQEATPAKLKNKRHPAKRVFQALRVAVNQELQALEQAIPAALAALAPGGRAISLAYQSQEDRIVKRAFQKHATSHAPHGLPVEPQELKARYRLVTRGAVRASAEETKKNPRAIPVRARVIERKTVNASLQANPPAHSPQNPVKETQC